MSRRRESRRNRKLRRYALETVARLRFADERPTFAVVAAVGVPITPRDIAEWMAQASRDGTQRFRMVFMTKVPGLPPIFTPEARELLTRIGYYVPEVQP